MSKDLSTLKQPETSQAYLERQAKKLLPDDQLDTLYEGQCDICGRGIVSEAEYSLCAPEGTILRVYCSLRCLATEDFAAVIATLQRGQATRVKHPSK